VDFNNYKPVKITGDSNNNWIAIATGDEFLIALKKDGTLWTKGALNEQLQHSGGKNVFFKVNDDTDWANFDAGKQHAVAIKKDGSLWAWGKNDDGQLGNGNIITAKDPVRIGTGNDWQYVSAGGSYSIALKKDGEAWYWGDTGFMKEKSMPTNVPIPFDYSMKYKCIAAGPGRLLLTFAKEKN
jgi:alpha-tubulin suppressor-like RCC1 family protein